MSILFLFSIALGIIFAIVSIIWIFSIKTNIYSLIDPIWSLSFFIHILIFNFLNPPLSTSKLLFTVMVCIWSIRLFSYLLKRLLSHLPQEDSRYIQLKSEYGANYKFRFFVFFHLQTLSVSFLTFPMIYVFKSQENISNLQIFFALIWLISILGESVADYQMNQFKNNIANKGEVCNIGLWRYSRHPNYFFECLIWISFSSYIVAATGLWWGIYPAIIMIYLITKVTGIPPSEAQSLKNRGDKYREYQKSTSILIPLPIKKNI